MQAYALALTLTFLALVLAAGALAGERDENVIGRLARGLVTLGGSSPRRSRSRVVAAGLGLGVALAFGPSIELGDVDRRRAVAAAAAPARRARSLAGAALGALGALLGALAREARTASLVSVLVVLPIVFLGLVPREVFPLAGWVCDALPFSHAVRLFSSALYDATRGGAVAREWPGSSASPPLFPLAPPRDAAPRAYPCRP